MRWPCEEIGPPARRRVRTERDDEPKLFAATPEWRGGVGPGPCGGANRRIDVNGWLGDGPQDGALDVGPRESPRFALEVVAPELPVAVGPDGTVLGEGGTASRWRTRFGSGGNLISRRSPRTSMRAGGRRASTGTRQDRDCRCGGLTAGAWRRVLGAECLFALKPSDSMALAAADARR